MTLRRNKRLQIIATSLEKHFLECVAGEGFLRATPLQGVSDKSLDANLFGEFHELSPVCTGLLPSTRATSVG